MDEDEDEGNSSKVSKVKPSMIAQLFENEDQRIDPIVVGERVLALFPGVYIMITGAPSPPLLYPSPLSPRSLTRALSPPHRSRSPRHLGVLPR